MKQISISKSFFLFLTLVFIGLATFGNAEAVVYRDATDLGTGGDLRDLTAVPPPAPSGTMAGRCEVRVVSNGYSGYTPLPQSQQPRDADAPAVWFYSNNTYGCGCENGFTVSMMSTGNMDSTAYLTQVFTCKKD